ncbi:glycosyltransferase family 2 protein [Microbulbifer harenosus]|uniref:Glycosyltransferase n=1 Tax=Microbulbifer harenosus TaxID=2576840 RepID=A0ABY2UN19_9GAMM|nr:glycosyltransferase family 2 protein [Microbulbifer harenosus]TLM80012.1 glycosyltransferase [Microbulbifer harenosus]
MSADSGGANSAASFVWHGRLPGKGWYMLEFQLAEARGARHVLLHVDCGEGFDPALTVTLPLRRGKIAKRICHFPARVRAARLEIFSVGEQDELGLRPATGYTVAHCCLAWLAPHFARDRLCQRLANMHRSFRGQSSRVVNKALKQEAAEKGRSWCSVALMHYGETFHNRCPDAGYTEWLAQVETEQMPGSKEVAGFVAALDTPVEFVLRLRLSAQTVEYALQAKRSVLAQSYPHWRLAVEVCPELQRARHPVIERFNAAAQDDTRLQIVNSPARLPEPEMPHNTLLYCSELPACGRLHPHALFFVARVVNQNPKAQLLYTDADSLNRAGGREAPLFKPGWNPDLLLAYNYVGQCCFFQRDLLQQLGFDFPAGQNLSVYGNLLRCRDVLPAATVTHIPRVLYHQKLLPGAALELLCEEEWQSLQTYLQSAEGDKHPVALEALPTRSVHGAAVARCRWPLPQPAPLVSLLIPTRDGVHILRRCVDSILEKTEYPNFEVLILDNQSRCAETLAYLAWVQSDTRVRVHRWNHPFNYSGINNYGATHARGSILGLINNDIEVITPGWLCEMVAHASRAEIGCVGAKLYYGNDTLQHGGVILGIGGTAGHSHKYALRDAAGYMGRLSAVQNLSAVTGACLVLRKSVFDEVGGLNEEYLAVAYNDVDLCLKVREAGYRNLWTPHAELYHHESVSRGADDTAAKRRRAQREADYMRRRWGSQLDSDPAYNPNLTLIFEDFSLA